MSRLSRLFHEQFITDLSLQDLRGQLSQCEPRVASLREIADQVYFSSATAERGELRTKLTFLSDRLASLIKICSYYCQILEEAKRSKTPSVSSTPTGRGASPAAGYSPQRSIIALTPEVSSFIKFPFTSRHSPG